MKRVCGCSGEIDAVVLEVDEFGPAGIGAAAFSVLDALHCRLFHDSTYNSQYFAKSITAMERLYQKIIEQHFAENQQMLFMAGPRQVGKTPLSLGKTPSSQS